MFDCFEIGVLGDLNLQQYVFCVVACDGFHFAVLEVLVLQN